MVDTTRVARRPRPSTNRHDPADERGFVLVWFALLIFVMLGVTAFAVDLGHAYLVAQRGQDAADAAALSSASYLPDNCVNANPHAQAIAASNGFTNGVAATEVIAVNGSPGGNGCDADPTLSPNQIRVKVKRSVDTWFGRAIGIDTLTVTRTSVAEYDPPVALGSPASYFGNLVGCATCDQPDIWASVTGRSNRKNDGNAIYADWCSSGADSADNCPSGLNNADRDTTGMLFQIKNPTLQPLNLALYDPGYVNTGPVCSSAPYPICTGDDNLILEDDNAPPLETTYTLYPLDNLSNPLGLPSICRATYPGYHDLPPASATDLTARSFHRWANFATDAALAGSSCPALNGSSYVLQVQTGDALGGPDEGGANQFSVAACSGCPPNQPTPDPRVSISAITKMSLFTNAPENSPNPKFYLARVPSWARGQFLTLTFFDIGDIGVGGDAIPGSLGVSAIDATHGAGGPLVGEFRNCDYSHPRSRDYVSGTTPWDAGASETSWARNPDRLETLGGGCTAQVEAPGTGPSYWNGKWATFKIPIPSDYTCDDRDQTKCWLQIRYGYQNAQFHDATTWTASLSGSPVRLIK